METTKCVLNVTGAECKHTNRQNIKMLMCGKHLREMYGLEMWHVTHETEMSHEVIGGFLKPAKGVVFKRNTVILPEQRFFDVTYRPEDIAEDREGEIPTVDMLQYHMNPSIQEFMSNMVNRNTRNQDSRLMYEVARNLCFPPKEANMGPFAGQDRLMENAVQYVTNKLALSEAQIEKQSIFSHIQTKNFIFYGGDELIPLAETKLSTCFKYMLSNCLFMGHDLHLIGGGSAVTDYLMFNTHYQKGVGLVATEDIADPIPLIISGNSEASPVYYNVVCSSKKKRFEPVPVRPRDMPEQFSSQRVFRGGSKECMV